MLAVDAEVLDTGLSWYQEHCRGFIVSHTIAYMYFHASRRNVTCTWHVQDRCRDYFGQLGQVFD